MPCSDGACTRTHARAHHTAGVRRVGLGRVLGHAGAVRGIVLLGLGSCSAVRLGLALAPREDAGGLRLHMSTPVMPLAAEGRRLSLHGDVWGVQRCRAQLELFGKQPYAATRARIGRRR